MCDPITLGIIGVNAAATVGAGALISKSMKKPNPKDLAQNLLNQQMASQLPNTAPAKTDADIQATVENQRSATNLSQLGFGANFKQTGSAEDSAALGVPGDYLRRALSAYRLGA